MAKKKKPYNAQKELEHLRKKQERLLHRLNQQHIIEENERQHKWNHND